MLFIIFILVLLFAMGVLLRGVNSVAEVWRNVTGKGNKQQSQSTDRSFSQDAARSAAEGETVLGGSSRTDLSSVKDVEFEKEQ